MAARGSLTARRVLLRKNGDSTLEWNAPSYSTALNIYDRWADQVLSLLRRGPQP